MLLLRFVLTVMQDMNLIMAIKQELKAILSMKRILAEAIIAMQAYWKAMAIICMVRIILNVKCAI